MGNCRLGHQSVSAALATPSQEGVAWRYVPCHCNYAFESSVLDLRCERCDVIVEIEKDHCSFPWQPGVVTDFRLPQANY
jgi:hypothetical protein